jgi:hypothetical protein
MGIDNRRIGPILLGEERNFSLIHSFLTGSVGSSVKGKGVWM